MEKFCDICKKFEGKETVAIVDGPTDFGPHAFMCRDHFLENGFQDSSINTFLKKEEES